MKKILLFYNTVKFIKISQLFWRIVYKFRNVKLPIVEVLRRHTNEKWSGDRYVQTSTDDGITFSFLGESRLVRKKWNDDNASKLWLYNLHYQDQLSSKKSYRNVELGAVLIDRWIQYNPPVGGVGWEPYCLSLRIVNWVKWFLTNDKSACNSLRETSLIHQAQALEQLLEYHILGNHLFANAKALIFAGAFFDGPLGQMLLSDGLLLIDQEIDEQFLTDGGHVERSPMYHSILVWDLCDLIELARVYELRSLLKRCDRWKNQVKISIVWLETMTHPDKDLSFFNDATLGVAPTLGEIKKYAKKLGILFDARDRPPLRQWKCSYLPTSGYVAVSMHNSKAIINLSEIGPSYQPGHSHADTFSFELSLFGQRVFVNSGVSEYKLGPVREFQRKTKAHNTLEVESRDSSEVWESFRVGRRARVSNVEMAQNGSEVIVSAVHDGYRRFFSSNKVKRSWFFLEKKIHICDEIELNSLDLVARLYCHPSVKLDRIYHSQVALVLGNAERIIISTDNSTKIKVVDSFWYPGFGQSVPNLCIELHGVGSTVFTEIDYSGQA